MRTYFFFLVSFLLMLFASLSVHSQISAGGEPPGLKMSGRSQEPVSVILQAPDVAQLIAEDQQRSQGGPERMGVSLQAAYTLSNSGTWSRLEEGGRLWRLKIESKGAVGLGLYFKDFHLMPGSSLFVYSADGSHVIGAFNSKNNRKDGFFATEVVQGDCIIVEYVEPVEVFGVSEFKIDEVLYVYQPMLFPGEKSVDARRAGFCQVNVACSEGDNWRSQSNSVVRILIKNGWMSFWCSGAILNNTALDYTPYILTADHCAKNSMYASPEDVAKWVFYFKYETSGCEDEEVSANKTMTGARKISSSSAMGNNGSDFYLLLLDENIPPGYEPYYAGWDISGSTSGSGVGIHHPAGDVKKISTYGSILLNSQWGVNPSTHFRVNWIATENGHGTTEGGSSGSPLFDDRGRIIGQLTGGESGCFNLNGPDYYGKMSFSWQSNGTADSTMLRPWLDPLNTGEIAIDGSANEKMVIARFVADTTVIAIGSGLRFSDLSIGNPVSWHWEFEGGEPASSNNADPGEIVYNSLGVFKVKLMVENMFSTDSLIRENYIRVVPIAYPNPAKDGFFVMLGQYTAPIDEIRVYDARSQLVYQKSNIPENEKFFKVNCKEWPSGLYIVQIRNSEGVFPAKVLKVKR